jgi:hypothetical protein
MTDQEELLYIVRPLIPYSLFKQYVITDNIKNFEISFKIPIELLKYNIVEFFKSKKNKTLNNEFKRVAKLMKLYK